MKILGIDYGTKRVGLALSYASLAEPLFILPNDAQLLEKLLEVIDKYKIEQLVLGLSENKMADKTKAFAQTLKKKINLPLYFYDETLSSHQVKEYLREQRLTSDKRPIDHLAAAVILQNFLDDQNKLDK